MPGGPVGGGGGGGTTGATCHSGRCLVALGTTDYEVPDEIAVGDQSVYWSAASQQVIKAVDKNGGATWVVASVPGGSWGVAVHGSDVFWTEDVSGSVVKLPQGGGTPVTIVSLVPSARARRAERNHVEVPARPDRRAASGQGGDRGGEADARGGIPITRACRVRSRRGVQGDRPSRAQRSGGRRPRVRAPDRDPARSRGCPRCRLRRAVSWRGPS